MGMDMRLPKRPLAPIKGTPEREKIFNQYDRNFKELDERRIPQQSIITAGSTDSETIQNILTGLNALLRALNQSDLSEE